MQNVVFRLASVVPFAEKLRRLRIFNPIVVILLAYICIILLGAGLLLLPWSTVDGRLGFTDALFTSTSATTVTGLAVKETGAYFTLFGQFIICALIQLGGVGYMAIFGFFLLSGDKRISFEHRMLLRETINSPTVQGIRKMARRIFIFIIGFEILGALILALTWASSFGIKAVWLGIFNSVSAFNNAGFDNLGTGSFESLARFATNPSVNLTIASLIILGGLGFYVLSDIARVVFNGKRGASYQTKVVVFATMLLLLTGTLAFFALEHNNALKDYTIPEKLLISFFNSVTPRTAGFSTLNVGGLAPLTLLIVIALMFIGASPGGTGGGIKTTTAVVFTGFIKKAWRGGSHINLFHKRIPNGLVDKAVAITAMAFALISAVTCLLVLVDKLPVLPALFETTSAFATVGLSTGITPSLSPIAKYLLMFTMYCGRVGVLTSLLVLSRSRKTPEIVLPEGELIL